MDSIYAKNDSTDEIRISDMFTPQGDIVVAKLIKDVCACIEAGTKREVALFYLNTQIAEIGKTYSEVTDSVVRDSIAFRVDIFLKMKGFEEMNFNDFSIL